MQNLQKTCSVLSFGSLLNDLGPPQRQCRDFSVNGQILSIPALASGKTAAAGLIVGLGISGQGSVNRPFGGGESAIGIFGGSASADTRQSGVYLPQTPGLSLGPIFYI